MDTYTPSSDILQKYADVLVKFALNDGKGIKQGDVVLVQVPEVAKPFYIPLRNTILQQGGYPVMQFLANDVQAADVFKLSSDEQLDFFPDKYYRGLVDQFDHSLFIIAESDKYELASVDPKKIFRRSKAFKPYQEWRNEKEGRGEFSWTVAMYGTEAMAKDVGMSVEEYWGEIITACNLDQADPVAKWAETFVEIERIRTNLNALEIATLHVRGEGIDLVVGVGPKRRWLGGGGRNIPSYELFISPDWRLTEGTVSFNQPLYRYGNVIEGITLRFAKGLVVEASATKNEEILKEMIAVENANKIGEYSLTDSRFSRIKRVMGETLFDENIGGEQGNTHMALGNAYQDSYTGDPSKVTDKEWDELGYNQSVVHTDIVSTTRRTVTATLMDGTKKVLYKDGQFQV